MSEDTEPTKGGEKRLPIIRIALVAILGILTAIVVFQNTESVETRLLFTTIVMPRAVLLFSTFVLGFTVGVVVSFLRRRSRK